MQEAKQSERDLVVLNVRLRVRGGAPRRAAAALRVCSRSWRGSVSPAVSAAERRSRGRHPGGGRSRPPPPSSAANDEIAQQQALVVRDVSRATPGSGQILFPELDPAGSAGCLRGDGRLRRAWSWPGVAGPEFGSTLLAGSMAGSAGFIRPVNAPETSGFGPRIHPLLGRPMFHTGIDLGAVCGTPIRAAADGTVVYASTTPSWGNRIIIAHSATLKTAYGHQSRMIAKVGDVVKQGQVIGLVGTTGWSTGCHLHFDVIVNNHYVDPRPVPRLRRNARHSRSRSTPPPRVAPAAHRSTPVVKNPNPPVIDGDVPIPSTAATDVRRRKPASTQPKAVQQLRRVALADHDQDPRPPVEDRHYHLPASPHSSTTAPPTTTTPVTPPLAHGHDASRDHDDDPAADRVDHLDDRADAADHAPDGAVHHGHPPRHPPRQRLTRRDALTESDTATPPTDTDGPDHRPGHVCQTDEHPTLATSVR